MESQTFDIIIVGGGTAGCVLAARLSAHSKLKVLVLEAGANRVNDPKVLTPLTSRSMFKDPDYDWCYTSTPQEGVDGRVFENTRGRMLGGSSAINSHSLVYPNKAMHEFWATVSGNPSWSWEHMEQYYRKFQSIQRSSPGGDKLDGPVQASYPAEIHVLQTAWEDVFASMGAKSEKDGLSGEAIGGFTTTNAIDGRPGKGERSHAGNTYLAPVMQRDNLIVETEALVHKIVFEKSGDNANAQLRATGVQYEKSGTVMLARATKEVILCAGAFGSPQLLELSGLGSRTVLELAGVKCLLDMPRVGENLQDHLNYGPSVEVVPEIETMDLAFRDPKVIIAQREQYDQHKTGPLAEGAAYSFAHCPLQLFNTPAENDVLQKLVANLSAVPDKLTQEQNDFVCRMITDKSEATATVFMVRMQRYTTPETRAAGNYMTIIAMLAHPFSRGSVHILSSDSKEHPRIDNGYLTHSLDAEIFAKHVVQIERLLAQDTFSSILKPNGDRLPYDFNRPLVTEDEAKKVIRKYSATNYHPCGTCVMAREGLGGVVDGQLRVHGTINLRVCDASIFPMIPRGNILSTVYAMAEQASDMILKDLE